jgi:hypothetical protein
MTSEHQPPVNNGHYFWVPRVAVLHMFDCIANFFVTNSMLRLLGSGYTTSITLSNKPQPHRHSPYVATGRLNVATSPNS